MADKILLAQQMNRLMQMQVQAANLDRDRNGDLDTAPWGT